MEKQRTMLLVLFLIVALLVPSCWAQGDLSKPSVTMPSQWELVEETPYPGVQSNYDPTGAGVEKFANQISGEVVWIFYEKAQVDSLSAEELEYEAMAIFERDDLSETRTIDDSGVKTYSGVQAGFAKGYDATDGTEVMEVVLIKGSYYLNVYAWYVADMESEGIVESLINSISVPGAGGDFLGGTTFLIIVTIAVLVVVAVVLAVVLIKRRRKSPPPETSPYYIPPPPPQ